MAKHILTEILCSVWPVDLFWPGLRKGSYSLSELSDLIDHNSLCFYPITLIFHQSSILKLIYVTISSTYRCCLLLLLYWSHHRCLLQVVGHYQVFTVHQCFVKTQQFLTTVYFIATWLFFCNPNTKAVWPLKTTQKPTYKVTDYSVSNFINGSVVGYSWHHILVLLKQLYTRCIFVTITLFLNVYIGST